MTKNSVGRPAKRDKDGNKVYRKICSVYLDIRLVNYIDGKVGNLSDWMEKAMKKAFENEYCFYCFDDKIEENQLNYKCSNPKHIFMDGKGAPSIILNWKNCQCGNSYEPDLVDGASYSGFIPDQIDPVCPNCNKEWHLLNPKEE